VVVELVAHHGDAQPRRVACIHGAVSARAMRRRSSITWSDWRSKVTLAPVRRRNTSKAPR
jgi:hypothetical protein